MSARSHVVSSAVPIVGRLYVGSSRAIGRLGPRRMVRRASSALRTPARMPSAYAPTNASAASPGSFGKSSDVASTYTGRRAEHVMNGATRIVARRSRRSGTARAAMIPGSAHAWLESSGTNE